MQSQQHFSQTYFEARAQFLSAAETAGLHVQSHLHPLRGRDGEALAMDVALMGAQSSKQLLIVSSACHGVEGFCGSGAQVALLQNTDFLAAQRASGVAVLLIHALNPHGFSWWRRTTHENVDLNRNFQDFTQPLPQNKGYDDIAGWVVPHTWPPSDAVNAQTQKFIDERGLPALQAAISGGQYAHPQGIFYGGVNPTWSNLTLRHVLREHGQTCQRLGWIDLHSGLGPSGVAERIFAGHDDAAAIARARAWWGQGGDHVTSIYDGSSSSPRLTGLMWTAANQECAQAEYTGIALEYGTVPPLEMMAALRADQWLENHPEAPPAQRTQIKTQIRDAFYTDTDEWKAAVLRQAVEATLQGLQGLAAR
jgi:Protein of unknown function (DUF2817)